jgi:hypothetical protein
MKVFILFDEEFPASPIVCIYSTLEKAQKAAAVAKRLWTRRVK